MIRFIARVHTSSESAELEVPGSCGAAFDDQAQIVVSGEVDRCDNVFGLGGRNRIDARCRRPGIDPAGGLRQTRLIADVVGILQLPKDLAAGRTVWRILTRSQR